MSLLQRIQTAKNFDQGNFKKVLFLCSAGLQRSPTAAQVYAAEPYNWNTRSAGVTDTYALNLVDEVLLEWADDIFTMDQQCYEKLVRMFNIDHDLDTKIHVLEVEDVYPYRSPALIKEIIRQVDDSMLEIRSDT